MSIQVFVTALRGAQTLYVIDTEISYTLNINKHIVNELIHKLKALDLQYIRSVYSVYNMTFFLLCLYI